MNALVQAMALRLAVHLQSRERHAAAACLLACGVLLLDKKGRMNVIFVSLTDLKGDAGAENITRHMIDALRNKCGLTLQQIADKLV